MRKLILFTLALMLTGCATSFDILKSAMPRFKGANISELVKYLGVPSSEYQTVGKTVYVWNTDRTSYFPNSTTSTTSGRVGNTPFTATTTSTGGYDQLSCTLRVVTSGGIIEDYDVHGNNGACFRYSDRLEMFAR